MTRTIYCSIFTCVLVSLCLCVFSTSAHAAAMFMEPGTDATYDLKFWTSTAGTVTSDSGQVNTGPRSIKFDSGAGNAAATAAKTGVASNYMQLTFYVRFASFPSAGSREFFLLRDNGNADVVGVQVTTGGVLQLTKGGGTQIGSNGSTLSTGTWYRISLTTNIAGTTVNEFRLFKNGTIDISVSNATLTNWIAQNLVLGYSSAPGANIVVNFDDIYTTDQGYSLTDVGDIKVTAKRPNAENTTAFDTAVGAARSTTDYNNVNERALSETNGWQDATANTPGAVENYGIENASTGDVNISSQTIVARTAWVWAKRGSGSVTTVASLYNNGTENTVTLGTSSALFTNIVTNNTYPSNAAAIGMRAIDGGADTFFYEGGTILAYAPSITVSGNVYTDEVSSGMNCTSSKTVTLKVNGLGSFSGSCTGNPGSYSISGVLAAPGDVISVFLDGATEKASAVIRTGTADITDAHLYQDRIIVRSADGASVTNTNLGQYDNTSDADMLFYSSTSPYTCRGVASSTGFCGDSGKKVVIVSGTTWFPNDNVVVDAMEVLGTYRGASETLNFLGSGTGSTCTAAAGTVRPLCVNGGTMTSTTNTTNFNGTSATALDGSNTWGYYNLGVGTTSDTGTGVTYTLANSNTTAQGVLTIGNTGSTNADVLDTSSNTLNFTGSGTPLSIPDITKGTFTGSTGSTVRHVGASATNITAAGATYYNLEITSCCSPTYQLGTAASQTLTVNGTMNIGQAGLGMTVSTSTHNPILDVGGDFIINTDATFVAPTSTFTVGGSWSNSGTFTDSSGTVTFDATSASKTISGTLNGSSDFYKVIFNGVGGGWTITDPMLVSAANATDTLQMKNGTVTLGNGNGDNLAVHGRWAIAADSGSGQNATFQTMSGLANGSTITIDMNANSSTPTCANCTIAVGTDSGTTANFKLKTNAILRLNPRSAATASDTYLVVDSTGYFEVLGSLDTSGTLDGTTHETTMTDTTQNWSTTRVGEAVRMTSGLAKGFVYDITANTATTLTRADTSSANTTVSGAPSTVGPITTLTTTASVISANHQEIGRYVHDTGGTSGWYKIVGSTEGGAADVLKVIAEPSTMNLANGDAIEISDGVQQGDTYEIINYAKVTAESSTCGAIANQTGASPGESWFYAQNGAEILIRYGQICNLGRQNNSIAAININGSNSNEGVLIDKSHFWKNYKGFVLVSSPNNSSANSKGITNTAFVDNLNHNIELYAASDGNFIDGNFIDAHGFTGRNNLHGIYMDASDNNTVSNNRIFRLSGHGIAVLNGSSGNSLTSNTAGGMDTSVYISDATSNFNSISSGTFFGNDEGGVVFFSDFNSVTSSSVYAHREYEGIVLGWGGSYYARNSIVTGNTVYANYLMGIRVDGADNSLIASNNTYYNGVLAATDGDGIYVRDATNSVIVSNTSYNNAGKGINLLSLTDKITIGLNNVYSNGLQGIDFANGATALSTVLFSNNTHDHSGIDGWRFGTTTHSTTSIYDTFSANNKDVETLAGGTSTFDFYGTSFGSGTEITSAGTDTIVSKKHDAANGVTKIWGAYTTPAASTETTPQVEETQKYNYADNLWEDSITPHFYSIGAGAGTEDTNLDFAFSGAMGGSANAYGYFVVHNGTDWDVYRNGTLLTAKATTGSLYTDSQNDGGSAPNAQFKIDNGGTAHTKGAAYSFVAYKKSSDTSTQKTITMVQDANSLTVPSGSTIQLKGQGVGSNETTITRGGASTDGYSVNIAGGIDAQYYTISYLKAVSDGYGLDLQSGATVTNLANGTFNNYQNTASASDAYIHVYSTLVGSGTPTIDFSGDTFVQTSGVPEKNIIEAGGSAPTGYWNFSSATCTNFPTDCESNDTDQGSGSGSIQFNTAASSTDGSFFAVFE